MTIPRVSIVTPSFNQAAYLEETLRSVLAQRDEIHEYIVMDGGSRDGSVDIIRRYADQLTYWQTGPDKGQADAIDNGFRRATGDILYWLNSDDVLLPGAIAAVRQAFEDPAVDVVSGWDVLIDKDSRVLLVHRPPGQTLWAARWGVIHVSQQGCFFRRNAYFSAGGMDRDLGCVLDTELWYRMLLQGARWKHLPRVLAAFRRHEAAKGSSWLERYRDEHELMSRRYPQFEGRNWKHRIGKLVYTGKELARLRYLHDAVDTFRLRGRPLHEAARILIGNDTP